VRIPATLRLAILVLGLLSGTRAPVFGQSKNERFWVAGRYDGTRILVYFDAVKFKGTLPPSAHKLAIPVAEGFFDAVELPATYISQYQKVAGAERFSIGDQYDLLLGNGGTATVTLTTLIGCEGDEFTGNDSFIGALATVKDRNSLLFTKNYYAVRRHREQPARPKPATAQTVYASLLDQSVRFNIQSRIVSLLTQRLKMAANVSPVLTVQSFRLANGSLRYYARAFWQSGKKGNNSDVAIGAWLTATVQVLAVETGIYSDSSDSWEVPSLLNVVDLGGGRTGLIVSSSGVESISLNLVEYRDGVSLKEMRTLQSIGAAE
jgi:hypothetical protein